VPHLPATRRQFRQVSTWGAPDWAVNLTDEEGCLLDPEASERRSDVPQQFVRLTRFLDEHRGPGFGGGFGIRDHTLGTQGDYRDVSRSYVSAQLLHGLEPVEHRHPEVHQHEVRRRGNGLFHSFGAVPGLLNREAPECEPQSPQFPNLGNVVHNKNPLWAR